MSPSKKQIILTIILIPSLLFNYFTFSLIDQDNNLSKFTTYLIFGFNIFNILFGFIYYKKNFKIFISILAYCILVLIFFDFTFEKILNTKSINQDDDELGWVLKANKEVLFNQKTSQGKNYKVKFKSSPINRFREYGNINNDIKKILIIGDSFTCGPYASNNEMYYSLIKKKFEENDINLEWFVMGASGYGNAQQFQLLKMYFKEIKPSIILYQFCVNDFFDNSFEISKLSTSHDQFYRRSYFDDNAFFKNDSLSSKLYRFFYRNSFIFKKIDQVYSYQKFKKYGRFTKDISDQYLANSIQNTQNIFLKIRELIGKETIFFSINCPDKKNESLSINWEKIIKSINGFPITEPVTQLFKAKELGKDIFYEDGGHLNFLGNKIYGETAAVEMIKLLKK